MSVPDASESDVVVATPSGITSSVVATPSVIAANGTSTSTLTVTVEDVSGQPLSGRLVTLAASGTANTLAPSSGVTDSAGRFVATLASTKVENKTVTATFGAVSISTVVKFVCAAHGTFAAPITTGVKNSVIAASDLDGDGKLDVAAVEYLYSGIVHVLFGKGDGTFEPSVDVAGSDEAMDVTIADFDNDAVLDIATADFAGNGPGMGVSIMRGLGSRMFAPGVHKDAGNSPHGLTAADFNADKVPDIAVADTFGSMVTVLLSEDAGTNQTYTAAYPNAVASADFNGDGKLDLGTTNGSGVSLALGNGDGTFAWVSPPQSDPAVNLVTADFNDDGKPDIATVSPTSGVAVFINNGDASFKPGVAYPTGPGPRAITTADFDRDGRADLAVANGSGTTVTLLYGKGDGSFEAPVDYPAGPSPIDIGSGDFNGDGNPDIAVTNLGASVSVLLFACP